MMDLSREAVTIMSELSIGVAMAVTQSVWARIVPRRTSCSCAMADYRENAEEVGGFQGGGNAEPADDKESIYTRGSRN